MKRILFSLLLAIGTIAVAQESGPYDVTCEGTVVGEATVTDDIATVTWDEGVQCETPYAIDDLAATLHFDANGDVIVVYEPGLPVDQDPVDDGEVPVDGDDPVAKEPVDGEDPVDDKEPVDDQDPVADDEADEGDAGDADAEDAGADKLTGLDRADEVAGENGAHGRDRARAAQGLDVDVEGKDEDAPEDEKHEKDDKDEVDTEVDAEVDAEVDDDVDADVDADFELDLDLD